MRKRAADFRPNRSPEGDLELAVLQAMEGQMSLQEISASLIARFPSRFRNQAEALVFVGEMSHRLSR
jgi:hypothetical protein